METAVEKTADKKPVTLKGLFEQDYVKTKMQEILGRNPSAFMNAVLQMVANNEMLKDSDPVSLYQCALVAATLDLEINNNLGFAYIIPFKKNWKDLDENGKEVWKSKTLAQFQIGYKGFIQLAQRTGQFKTISATPVYQGQLIEENPLTGYKFDWSAKKSDTIIGFASYFELINGFEKTLYMSNEALKNHGMKYSQSFKNEKTRKSSLWETNFEAMGIKTVIKLLISKYAPLSVKYLQTAILADQSVITESENGEPDFQYPDNEAEPIAIANPVDERINTFIQSAKTIEQLDELAIKLEAEGQTMSAEQKANYDLKYTSLKGGKSK